MRKGKGKAKSNDNGEVEDEDVEQIPVVTAKSNKGKGKGQVRSNENGNAEDDRIEGIPARPPPPLCPIPLNSQMYEERCAFCENQGRDGYVVMNGGACLYCAA